MTEVKGSILRFVIGLGVPVAIGALIFGAYLEKKPEEKVSGWQDWEAFRGQFITAEGRVIDDVNGGISHSEGQGYAMFLATHWKDRETFDLLWQWTRKSLQIRGEDQLFAWRWEKKGPAEGKVTDLNNASDGDVLIAWALCRGYWEWEADEYLTEAREICRSIREKVVHASTYGPLLIPGAYGFEPASGKAVVNLSYWVFPAFTDLEKVDGADRLWSRLIKSGMRLLSEASFGEYGLPPDWLEVGETLKPAEGFDPVFGYNAIRIPLYLGWISDEEKTAVLLRPFVDFASRCSNIPAPVPARVAMGATEIQSEPAPLGMTQVLRYARWLGGDNSLETLQPLDVSQGYYSSVLQLLVRCAMEEGPEGGLAAAPRVVGPEAST